MEREKHTAESIMALVRQLSGAERTKLQHMLNGSQGNASDLGDAAYRWFSRANGHMLVQIKGGRGTVKGIYHIQHLNAYHWTLKDFLRRFKGVSTKYLNNYLIWNNTAMHGGGSLTEKLNALLERIMTDLFEVTCRQIPIRPPVPVLMKNQS